ncbi:MAG TPA: AAA family ATPase, partial [Mycobacteriales bacterium]|nr:AAA family ATPase [Mycobacteriales bacterium]
MAAVERFPGALRRRRLAARLSQERLAELSGISARAIRDMERGRVCRPRPESVRLLGAALGLTGSDLVDFRRLADDAYWADRGPGAAPARSPAVAQLPAAVAGFTGRRDDLDRLDRLLAGPHEAGSGRVVLVTGPPGVGKTALAVQWAHRAAGAFPDGQLHVDLRGYDPDQPVTAAEALAGFLRALGVTGDAVAYDLAERAATYRTLLAERRLLVVLDNALSTEQVAPLLPGTGSCPVLVTSRGSLPGLVARHGAYRLKLGLLPEPDAVDLLRVLIGDQVAAEPA